MELGRVPTTESEPQPPFLSPIVFVPKFTDVDFVEATSVVAKTRVALFLFESHF